MTRKNYALIPVLAAIVLIPQFLFWWLAPAEATARLAVYIGGTLFTVEIPVAYLVAYWNSNLRKAAGLSVVCCILETAVIALSALLLEIDVSVRSAVFAFIITALVCLIALIPLVPLVNTALHQQRQGVYSASIPVEPSSQPVREVQNHSNRATGIQPHNPIPARMPHQTTASKPLPPRNR